jgi:NADPH-dependent glutamate synthase beta subunit-like oxidoreductase
VKLTVDGASCMGHGRGYQMAPDLLAYDDEGYVTIRDQTIDVPDDQVDAAEDAEGTCPEPGHHPDRGVSRAVTTRAAVIGAGPSGFYAADHLLREGIAVDLFDALPTPYGLVRAGVAPDHPKIKSVTRMYDKTAQHPDSRFFGGVELGADVTREDLLERYHAVLYAVGTSTDNGLGIPGDDRPGSVAATQFVAWYNGHPGYADETFDLSCSRAVVIGNGNVAIDVARMLVLDPDELATTDTAGHAIEAFARASVTEVTILGRRGPAQAAFTNPELRELGELVRADVVVDPADLELDPHSAAWLESDDALPPPGGTSQCCASSQAGKAAEGRIGSSCASAARRSRSSATERGRSRGCAWCAIGSSRTPGEASERWPPGSRS